MSIRNLNRKGVVVDKDMGMVPGSGNTAFCILALARNIQPHIFRAYPMLHTTNVRPDEPKKRHEPVFMGKTNQF